MTSVSRLLVALLVVFFNRRFLSYSRLQWLVVLSSTCVFSCTAISSSSDANTYTDLGVDDGIRPPDLFVVDTGLKGVVGGPCQEDSDCSDNGVCLKVGQGKGVCTIPGCTMEDLDTSIKEDDCPKETVCSSIPIEKENSEIENVNLCLPKCTPSSLENPCAKFNSGLACDPISIFFTGHTEICLIPACSEGDPNSCPTSSVLETDIHCDAVTGVCFVDGTEGVLIGSSCNDSTECGPKQICFRAQGAAGTDNEIFGGYCTKVGCAYGGNWECPLQSSCFQMGSLQAISMCLATGCDPNAPDETDDCRDEAPLGAYDCLSIGAETVCWITPK